MFDFYSTNVRLKFKRSTELQTSLGGKVSSVVYIIVFILVIYLFVDLNQKNNQSVISFPQMLSVPQLININYTNLNPNDDNKESYFFWFFLFINKTINKPIPKEDIDRIFYIETLDEYKNSTSIPRPLNAISYTYSRCGDLYPQGFVANVSYINEGLCINLKNHTIEGDYISPIFHFLQMKLKNCSSSQIQSQKVKCLPDATVVGMLPFIQMELYYLTYALDTTKHGDSKPYNYMFNKISLVPMNSFYLKHDIYLQRSLFKSSEDVYFPFTDPIKFPIVKVSNIRQMVSKITSSYVAFYLRSDYAFFTYQRTYKTFLQLLSQYGGIWIILFVIGGLIMVPLNSKLLRVELANKILNLISPDLHASEETYKNLIKGDRNEKLRNLLKMNNKSKLECIVSIDYFKYERNKGLPFTVREAFISTLCCWCAPKNVRIKENIYDLAFEELDRRTDISTLFDYSKQFKILKNVLFGNLGIFLNTGYAKSIHSKKLNTLEQYLEKLDEIENHNAYQAAFWKETQFINGIRSLKFKPILDERIDVNLIKLFNFKKEFIRRYFINHMHILSNKLDIEGGETDKKDDEDFGNLKKDTLDLDLFE